MRSPAASIAALCLDGRRAVEGDRSEALDEVMARLAEIGFPENAGTVDEIETALAETERFHRAVERAAGGVAREMAHIQQGRRALDGYEGTTIKGPRAVDMSA